MLKCGVAIIGKDDASRLGMKKLRSINGKVDLAGTRERVLPFIDKKLSPYFNDTPGALFPKIDGTELVVADIDCTMPGHYHSIQKKELVEEMKHLAKTGTAPVFSPGGVLDKAGGFETVDDACVFVYNRNEMACDITRRDRIAKFGERTLPDVDDDDWLVSFVYHR